MHAVERPTMKRARLHLYVAAILPLLALLLLPGAARAQWTTTGSNISNSNAGNVGVGTGTNAPASRLEVVNPTGGSSSVNYFQVTGATGDNSNYPGLQLKGGTLATEFPQFKLSNGGLAASLIGGRSATYGNRMGLSLSSNSATNAYASLQKFDGTTTTDLFVVRDSGNVGIGTLAPGYRLHLAGDNTQAGGYPVIKMENTQAGGHSWWLYAGAWGVPGAFGLYDETAQKYRLFFDASGNAGMGTLSPAFDANGSKYFALDSGSTVLSTVGVGSMQAGTTSTLGYLSFFNSSLATTEKRNASIVGANDGAANSGNLQFYTASAGALGERVRIDNAGRVGIGTSGPTTRLTITDGAATPYAAAATDLLQLKRNTTNGTADDGTSILFANVSNGFRIKYGGTSDRLSFIDGGSVEVLSLVNGGNVGVGTASPLQRLDVSGVVGLGPAGAGYDVLNIVPGTAAVGQVTSIKAFNSNSLQLTTYNPGASAYNSGVTIATTGNVGIGPNTSNPTHTLEVGGDVNTTGAITAGGAITGATVNAVYQDVAEWVPSTQKLAAGTVVVLDTTQANHVLASTKAYDTGVAGVISDSPGVILGQGGGDKLKVATTGRVKVRVDATSAPIKVGDLLVTGEAEGVAMKSIPVDLGGVQIHRPGTIIGKALEPLDKGTGEILVLLSLQ